MNPVEPIGLSDDTPIRTKDAHIPKDKRKLMKNVKTDIAVLKNRLQYYLNVRPCSDQTDRVIAEIQETLKALMQLRDSIWEYH